MRLLLEYLVAVTRARARRQAKATEEILRQGMGVYDKDGKVVRKGDWRALLELLRRTDPKRWNIAQGVSLSAETEEGKIPLDVLAFIAKSANVEAEDQQDGERQVARE